MEFDVKFGIITLNSIVFQKRHFVLGHPILAGWITLVREREREREKEKQEKKIPTTYSSQWGRGWPNEILYKLVLMCGFWQQLTKILCFWPVIS